MQKNHNAGGADNASLSAPTSNEVEDGLDRVFEVQTTMRVLGKRLCSIGSLETADVNQDEIFDLSRVTDICVRTLDDVAFLLDRWETARKAELRQ